MNGHFAEWNVTGMPIWQCLKVMFFIQHFVYMFVTFLPVGLFTVCCFN